MLVVMRHGAPQEDIDRVVATIEEMGYQARPMPGKQRTTVGLVGNAGLKLLARAREETGLLIVTEAMDAEGLDHVLEVADIVQIGARNMQNYSLLKRGLSATITELLLSAEYILAEGNPEVILCERGVRGFDTTTRNLFDLSAIPVVHGLSHLPIVADPSHGTGHRDMVIPMARAAA